MFRKLKRDSIPKLPPALDETDILLIQKEEEVSFFNYNLFTLYKNIFIYSNKNTLHQYKYQLIHK